MDDLKVHLRNAAPRPAGPLDTTEVGRRAALLARRRTVRRAAGAGAAAVLVLVAGGLWAQSRGGPSAVVGDPIDVAEDPVGPEVSVPESVMVDVSLVTTTYDAEGSYRCEPGDPVTTVAAQVVTQTWSDPENERWMSRTDFDQGPVDQLAFGNPYYPTQVFLRGDFPDPQPTCPTGHPAGQVVNIVSGGGSGGPVRGVPVMTESQEHSLEGLRLDFRRTAVESGTGVDSLGRSAGIWTSEPVGGFIQWGDELVPVEQRKEWFVDADTERVLEHTWTSSYGDLGEANSTTTYSDPVTVTIDAAQFDPTGYSDETDGWLFNRYPTHVAEPATEEIPIGSEWIWPVEPRAIEPADLVAAFAVEVLDADDAVVREKEEGLPDSFEIGVGDLTLSARVAEVAGGAVLTDVASSGFNGSQGVNVFVAPGALLSVQVPRVASHYTIVVAGVDGPSTWAVDGIEVAASATTSTTTLAPDGIQVIENDSARAAITIPGLLYVDAERVFVVGRDDDGTLRHVAADLSIGP